jgi:opacity protein-like surface antigen
MKRIITTLALLSCVWVPAAQAQRFGVELRAGPAFPTEELQGATVNPGGGAGFSVNYRIMPHTVAYAGWDWHMFAMDEPFAGGQYDVVSTGYAFGLQFEHPLRGRLGAFARGGALYNHLELEEEDGVIRTDSGHELGWEAGGGLRFDVTDRFALTPGVRYRTVDAELMVDNAKYPVTMSYVAAEIGMRWTLGGAITVANARTR